MQKSARTAHLGPCAQRLQQKYTSQAAQHTFGPLLQNCGRGNLVLTFRFPGNLVHNFAKPGNLTLKFEEPGNLALCQLSGAGNLVQNFANPGNLVPLCAKPGNLA